jgi:hypothetical protein
VTGCERGRATVDVVIPFAWSDAQPERFANLIASVTSVVDAGGLLGDVVIAELGREPTAREVAHRLGVRHVFEPDPGVFSVGKCQNLGYRALRRPLAILFHQADFLLRPAALAEALHVLADPGVPAFFPHWGLVELSACTSAVLRSAPVSARRECIGALWAAMRSNIVRAQDAAFGLATDRQREIVPPDWVSARLREWLPRACLQGACAHPRGWDDSQVLGEYRWSERATRNGLCRISGGPRASASYLVRSDAYEAVGGIPEFVGWGYEDLTFWSRLATHFDFRLALDGIYFGSRRVSGDTPLVHLWHSHPDASPYYANVAENRARYAAAR